MGFVKRVFTPPGTGGAEAAMIQAQTDIKNATTQLSAAAPPPTAPTMASAGKAPEAPGPLIPGQAPGAKKAGGIAAPSILGAAATAQQKVKSVLG